MTLGVATLIGLLVAWALGARLTALADVRFRGDWMVFGSLALQIVIFTSLRDSVPAGWHQPVHMVSYLLILLFLLRNIRVPGFWLTTIGIGLNMLVIFLNGGRMPVSLDAWRATGADPTLITQTGGYNNNVLADATTRLPWLGDIFALPPSVPLATVVSLGDVLIVIGVAAFVYRSCVPRIARPQAGLFDPLRVAEFRRVLGGRATSKLGDWISMSAIVTWLYSETRSGTVVAAFLLARMVAQMMGGAVAAPLLDRLSGFRVLSAVEGMRGVVTLLMLPLALSGHLVLVVALVCVSTALGAATNPSASGLLPDVLPAGMLQAGNAMHGVARNVTAVAGTLLGGYSVSAFGIGTALVIDLGTFLLAGLLYLRFAAMPSHADEHPTTEPVSRRTLLRAVAGSRVAVGLTVSFTVVTVAMGLLNSSLPMFFDLRFDDPAAYGYALAAILLGEMAGEALTGFIRRESVARRSVGLAFLAMAGTLFVLSDSSVAATAYLMLFLLGAADGTTEVVYDTLFQLHLPRRVLSGAYAIAGSLQHGGQAAGFVLAILYARHGPGPGPVRAAAALCIVGAVVAGLMLFRRTGISPADDTIEGAAVAAPRAAAAPVLEPIALERPLPAAPLTAFDGTPASLRDLVADGPVVLALLALEADEHPHAAMLRDVAEAGGQVVVVTAGASPAAALLATSGHARRFDDPHAVLAAAFGAGAGASALAVADGEGIVRLLFAEAEPGAWLPASVVLSRLRRLGGLGAPRVRVVRTNITGTPVPRPVHDG